MEKKRNFQQRGEETRARILQVAEESFARQGYDAVGLAEICQQAAVSKGAFYHHFPSKEALFLELLDKWLSGIDQQLQAASVQAKSVQDGVLRLAIVFFQVLREARWKYMILLEFLTKAMRDKNVWQATIAYLRRYRDFFAQWIRAGIEQGVLRKSINPELAAQGVISFAIGLLLQGILDPPGEESKETFNQSINLLLEGLMKK